MIDVQALNQAEVTVYAVPFDHVEHLVQMAVLELHDLDRLSYSVLLFSIEPHARTHGFAMTTVSTSCP